MKRLILALISLLAIATGIIFFLCQRVAKHRYDNDRLRINQEVLLSERLTRPVVTRSGDTAMQTVRLTIATQELKDANERLTNEVHDLRVKLRNLQSVDRTTSRTEYVFVPETVYLSPLAQPTLTFNDPWTQWTLDSSGVHFLSLDTLTVVRHQTIRRFLFWVRRRDKYVTVHNVNPHTQITTVESIDIE